MSGKSRGVWSQGGHQVTTYYGFRIDRIYDDVDYETVIGYDVVEASIDPDGLVPVAEMLPTIAACKEVIREEVRYRRVFGLAIS